MFTQYIRKEMNTFMAKNAKLSTVSDTQSEMRVSGSKSNGDFTHFHMLKHQYSMSSQPLNTAQNRNATSPINNPYLSGGGPGETSLTP